LFGDVTNLNDTADDIFLVAAKRLAIQAKRRRWRGTEGFAVPVAAFEGGTPPECLKWDGIGQVSQGLVYGLGIRIEEFERLAIHTSNQSIEIRCDDCLIHARQNVTGKGLDALKSSLGASVSVPQELNGKSGHHQIQNDEQGKAELPTELSCERSCFVSPFCWKLFDEVADDFLLLKRVIHDPQGDAESGNTE